MSMAAKVSGGEDPIEAREEEEEEEDEGYRLANVAPSPGNSDRFVGPRSADAAPMLTSGEDLSSGAPRYGYV